MKPVGLLAGAVLILFLIAGIYGYEESFQNMSYALFLILFFGGWLALWDYGHYYRKCRKLKEAPEHMGERIGDLPGREHAGTVISGFNQCRGAGETKADHRI